MSTHSTIYVGNTTVLKLTGLQNADGTYQNNATVQLTSLVDKRTGTAVTGVTLPMTMSYVTSSNGQYEAELASTLGITAERWYVATVVATSAAGDVGQWTEDVYATTRRA